jgi:hypothetical protein
VLTGENGFVFPQVICDGLCRGENGFEVVISVLVEKEEEGYLGCEELTLLRMRVGEVVL